jgi:hypothetical protein
MFLGVTKQSWVYAVGSSLSLSLIGAFSKYNITQSGETFITLFSFVFVWTLIFGVVFLQENISNKDYKKIMNMESGGVYTNQEVSFLVTLSVWLNYWYAIIKVHRYVVLVFFETLFVGGFYIFFK